MQWASGGSVKELHDIKEEDENRIFLAIGERLRDYRFQITASTVQDARAVTAVYPFTAKLPWGFHPFYIQRYFGMSARIKSRVHEQKILFLVLVVCREILCSSLRSTEQKNRWKQKVGKTLDRLSRGTRLISSFVRAPRRSSRERLRGSRRRMV